MVVGTRPEAIKTAPVIYELKQHSDKFETIILATAQHREILDQALSLFDITPDIDLNLMHSRQGLPALTSRVLEGMEKTIGEIKPDILLVQGDTTTVFASALAAFYHKVPVAHVEAGLRSHDIYSPYPEEVNRRLTTVMTSIHFAPTLFAKKALLNEGVPADKIVVTGNTVVDALTHISQIPFTFDKSEIKGLKLDSQRIILVTSHRRESWGAEFENTCAAIKELVRKYSDIVVVYPVHPNPAVKETAEILLSGIDRIHLLPPLDYLTFINLMKKAYLIITDSGGLQEEAPTLKKPLLLLRKVTERPEAFHDGLSRFVGTNRDKIIREAEILLNSKSEYASMITNKNPYGDGFAAQRIVETLIRWSAGKNILLDPSSEFNQNNQEPVISKQDGGQNRKIVS